MLHQGQEKTRLANLDRWKSERGGPLRGRRPSVAGRSFEEVLALFGRQIRDEAGEKNGHPASVASPGAATA